MTTRKTKAGPANRIIKAVSAVFPENHFLQTTEYTVASPKIPAEFDGFRMVHLSDLHGCNFGTDNRRLLTAVEKAAPDAVVLTGDTADRTTKSYETLFRFLGNLCAEFPVCAILGNHEQDLSALKRKVLLNGMRARGVYLLDNEDIRLTRGDRSIRLYGYRLPLRYYRADHRKKARPVLAKADITAAVGACSPREYSILLAHNPLCFEAYAAWGADLTLCGHVHGGMVRLPHFGALLSPERSFFPRFSEGVYASEKYPDRKMIVSRGLGSGMRIHNLPEIVVLTLRSSRRPGERP